MAGGGLAACLALLALSWFVWQAVSSRRAQAAAAALAPRQPLGREQQASPAEVPAEENAAFIYQAVLPSLVRPGESLSAAELRPLLDVEALLASSAETAGSPALRAEVRQMYSDPGRQEALEALRRASVRDYCQFTMENEVGPELSSALLAGFYRGVQLVVGRAMLTPEEGVLADAMMWFATALRMARHLGSHPSLVAQLYQYALQTFIAERLEATIARRQVPTPASAELMAVIRNTELNPSVGPMVDQELTFGLDLFDLAKSRPQEALQQLNRRGRLLSPEPLPSLPGWVYRSRLGRPLLFSDKALYLELMGTCRSLIEQPFADHAAEWLRLESRAQQAWLIRRFGGLTPALTRDLCTVAMKRDAAQAELNLALVALALKNFRWEHNRYPENLYELERSVAWEVPRDPFTGKRLGYEWNGAGFLLYSLGPDGRRQAGKDTAVVLFGPQREGDITWRAFE